VRCFHAALGEGVWKPSRPEFLAPEQLDQSGTVDARTDLYSLGATLYWSLTGKTPFAPRLDGRPKPPPPRLKDCGVEAPDVLQSLLEGLLAHRPEDRPAQAAEVLEALGKVVPQAGATVAAPATAAPQEAAAPVPGGTVLVIDADEQAGAACRSALAEEGLTVDLAATGKAGAEQTLAGNHDVLVLAAELPDLSGLDLLRHLRKHPPRPNLKIVMLCGTVTPEAISQVLAGGADDYLTKPVDPIQLRMRVKTALHLRQTQIQADVEAAAVAGKVSTVPAEVPGRRRTLGGLLRPLGWLFGA
jgi:serine/threonine-protein kinase